MQESTDACSSSPSRCVPFIGVHIGAGNISIKREDDYIELIQSACTVAHAALVNGATCHEAVATALKLLEDSTLVNAGSGSNLTTDGKVECDASIAYTMPSGMRTHGAVGCLSGIRNPIAAAAKLAAYSAPELVAHGKVPPRLLVGLGALAWVQEHGCETISADEQACEKARKELAYYQSRIESASGHAAPPPSDTIGAVCVDQYGQVCAGASSGGLLLKTPGRIGPAATYGASCWVESSNGCCFAVAGSGCGETLMETFFARTVCKGLEQSKGLRVILDQVSGQYEEATRKNVGVIALAMDAKTREIRFCVGRNTMAFGIGYRHGEHKLARIDRSNSYCSETVFPSST